MRGSVSAHESRFACCPPTVRFALPIRRAMNRSTRWTWAIQAGTGIDADTEPVNRIAAEPSAPRHPEDVRAVARQRQTGFATARAVSRAPTRARPRRRAC